MVEHCADISISCRCSLLLVCIYNQIIECQHSCIICLIIQLIIISGNNTFGVKYVNMSGAARPCHLISESCHKIRTLFVIISCSCFCFLPLIQILGRICLRIAACSFVDGWCSIIINAVLGCCSCRIKIV